MIFEREKKYEKFSRVMTAFADFILIFIVQKCKFFMLIKNGFFILKPVELSRLHFFKFNRDYLQI